MANLIDLLDSATLTILMYPIIKICFAAMYH